MSLRPPASAVNSSATSGASAVASFPWPFLHPCPPAAEPLSGALVKSDRAPAAAAAVAPTPNFDSVLAHVAGSAMSPLVRADVGPHAPNGARAGVQRVRGFDVLSRTRADSLRRAWEELEAQQRRYYSNTLLHSHLSSLVAQLQAQHPASRAAEVSGASSSFASAAADQQAALVNDLACLWPLAQAEAFLRLDGEDAARTNSNNGTQAASEAASEATAYGLEWSSLSGTFMPASAAVPAVAHGAQAPPTSHRAHSFTAAASGSLGAALSALIVPALESSLQERVEELWNGFDPRAEERRAAEEEAAEQDRAHASPPSVDVPDVRAWSAGLPALRSDDLESLVSHRLAGLHARESALQRSEHALARQEAARQTAVVSSLALTAHLLGQQHLSEHAAQRLSTVRYLRAKLRVLSSKVAKVAASVQRDTYLGLAHAQSQAHMRDESSRGALILPALRVLEHTLSGLRAQRMAERAEKQRALERYQQLGPHMAQLAQELQALQAQIEHKKWTLQQMN